MNPAEVVAFGVAAYLVLVALLLGSFINLAADRLPRGESLLRPRSHCRACGRVLNLVDLIPVGGYLVRGGRCATCDAPIGVSSPAAEALCGAGMLVPLALLGPIRGAPVGFAAVALVGVAAVSFAFFRARRSRRGSQNGGPSGSERLAR
jgi:leader peptidase (prepilin peptidase) / N-methyltransferase